LVDFAEQILADMWEFHVSALYLLELFLLPVNSNVRGGYFIAPTKKKLAKTFIL